LRFQQFAQLCKTVSEPVSPLRHRFVRLTRELNLLASALAVFVMPRHMGQRQHDFFIDEVAHAYAVALDQKNFHLLRHPVGSGVVADQCHARLHLHRPAHRLHAALANYFRLCTDFEIGNRLAQLPREAHMSPGFAFGTRELTRDPGQFRERDRKIERRLGAYQGVDESATGPAQ
jgi:hypothetical protein